MDKHKGIMPSDMDLRSQEESKLRAMVNCILTRANEATMILKKNRINLPGEKLASENLSPVQQGLLDHTMRNPDWRRKFAKEMHAYLLDVRIDVKGEKCFLGLGEVETTRWISIIEDFL